MAKTRCENDATFTAAPKTTATTRTITNLAPDTTYKLRVYAVGDGANYSDSEYCTVKAVKTKAVSAGSVLDEAFADFFEEELFEEI